MVFQYICEISQVTWLSTLKLHVVILTYVDQLDLVLIFVPRQKEIRQCCISNIIYKYSLKKSTQATGTTSHAKILWKPKIYNHSQQRLGTISNPSTRNLKLAYS